MSTVTSPESTPAAPPPVKKGEPPWNVALLFPAQGNWTEQDYLALNTNRLVELSDGCLEVLPMPFPWHQWIVQLLHGLLNDFVRRNQLGDAFFAPLPIRLYPGTLREPDVLFFRPERLTDLRKVPDGADLVMEVVSEGTENRERDLQEKRKDYEQAAIPEYWIVDPELKQITVLTLDAGRYREHGVFRGEETATSKLLDGFSVPVNEVFNVPDRSTPQESI